MKTLQLTDLLQQIDKGVKIYIESIPVECAELFGWECLFQVREEFCISNGTKFIDLSIVLNDPFPAPTAHTLKQKIAA